MTATTLPHPFITPIDNSEPDATPILWNSRYQEINENFSAVADALDKINAHDVQTTFVTSGDAPNFVLQPVPAPTALTPYLRFQVQFHVNGVGDNSVDVGLGSTTALKQYDSTGSKIAASIAAGQCCDIEYDGVDFMVLNPLPTAQNNTGDANALIAQHEAKKNPHPQYVPLWESGQVYVIGDIRHSKQDGRVFKSKFNFDNGEGDSHYKNVTLLTDVVGSTVVDKSSSAAVITAAPDVIFGNAALGHQLIHVLGSQRISSDQGGDPTYDFSVPASQAQFGSGDFCIEIYIENCVFTDVYKDVIDFGSFKIQIKNYYIKFSNSVDAHTYQIGSASLDLGNGSGKYIIISRNNGLMSVSVASNENNFFIPNYSAWNFPVNLSATQPIHISGPSGITVDIAIRITVGNSRIENSFIPQSWPDALAIGPSIIDPALDSAHWELMYSMPVVDIAAAVAAAVANALPAAIAQGVDEKMVGTIADFDLPAPLPGWLELNGNAVLISDFPRLNNVMYCGDVHNATAEFWYHCADPQNPNGTRLTTGAYLVTRDARGMFRRAWDHGRGIDVGRALGSYQADANKSHSHSVSDAGHTHSMPSVKAMNISLNDVEMYVELTEAEQSRHGYTNSIQRATESQSAGISLNESGESDGHPKNWAALTCIKY